MPHQILALERLLFQKFDLAEVFVLEVLRLRAEVLIVLQAFDDVSVTYRRLPDVHVEHGLLKYVFVFQLTEELMVGFLPVPVITHRDEARYGEVIRPHQRHQENANFQGGLQDRFQESLQYPLIREYDLRCGELHVPFPRLPDHHKPMQIPPVYLHLLQEEMSGLVLRFLFQNPGYPVHMERKYLRREEQPVLSGGHVPRGSDVQHLTDAFAGSVFQYVQ